MASEHDLIKGDTMIEHIKDIAPLIAVIVATVAGWWTWRTSYLKALSDRVVHLESRLDQLATLNAALQLREASLTAENLTLAGKLEAAEKELELWTHRYEIKGERQKAHPGLQEDSEAKADDDLKARRRADRSDGSGLIAVPPGGMPK